jgi:hypothetical protein
VDQAAPYDYYVKIGTQASLPVAWGRQYSATLWARASTPRRITLAMGNAPSEIGSADLTTQWRRFQVVLTPNAAGTARLEIQCGLTPGDVWVDDVHFQEGVSSLYRRDFQNGIVLVNPSNYLMVAPLERTFQKIAGTVAPEVNDGSSVTSVTVPPSDALFLLSSDILPPAPVMDLRRTP